MCGPRRLLALLCGWTLFVLVSSGARHAHAGDPYVRWYTLETPHFLVHYHGGLEAVAQKAANVAEDAYERLVPELGFAMKERTALVLTDGPELANGFASVLPYPVVRLWVSAPDDMSALGDYDDWLTSLVTHEFAHILHIANISGLPRAVNAVMGPTIAPNHHQPNWIIEGLAVAMETTLTSGGRLRSAQFEMQLRADVLGGRFARLDEISHLPRRWPGGTLWYLYGAKFFEWITSIYGPDVYAAVAADYGASVIPYGVNRAIRRVTGRTYEELYDAWHADLQRRYGELRAELERAGLREGRRLTHGGGELMHPRFVPAHCGSEPRLAYVKNDLDSVGGVYVAPWDGRALDGREQLFARSSGRTFAYEPDCGLVFTTFLPSRRQYSFSDLVRLPAGVAAPGGSEKSRQRLTFGRRARDVALSADGRRAAYVTNDRGTTTLRLASYTADHRLIDERRLVPSAAFEQAFTPRFSPDGTRVAYATWTAGGFRDIRVVDVATGSFFQLSRDRAVDQHPAWSPDGKLLYFSSDRTGIPNVYAYELATGALYQVTNVLTGAYMPEPSPDGRSLVYVGYGPDGFDLYVLPLEPSQFRAAPASKSERPLPAAGALRYFPPRPYSALPSLLPRAWTVSYGSGTYGNALTLGTTGADAVGHHAFSAALTLHTTKLEEPFVAFDYLYDRLPFVFRMTAFRDAAPRNDYRVGLETREVTERQLGVTTGVGLPVPGEFALQQLALSYTLAHWSHDRPLDGGLDPYALLPVEPQSGLIGIVRVGYEFTNASTTPNAISTERGVWLQAAADFANRAWGSESTLTAFSARAGAYVPMPWLRHHVLALALSGASAVGSYARYGLYSTGGYADTPPFDALASGIRQTGFVLRGYEPGSFSGSSFALANAEYRFPIAYIDRGISTLPGFLRSLSGTLFVDWGGTYETLNLRNPYLPFHVGVGGELRVDFSLTYADASEVRIGIARGLDSEAPKGFQSYFVAATGF